MKLLCIDSNSILNRAFYGIRLLTAKDGTATNAVLGYMNIFLKLLAEEQPDAVACAFDLPKPTFRHEMYEGYKAGRKAMPEELAQQLPLIRELLTDLGYQIVECPGYEADDILGAFAEMCDRSGDECVIATGDRDSLQLVSDRVTVLLAATKQGKPVTTRFDPAAVREYYGVGPEQVVDIKAVMGDTSDNIPGVHGIGEKGAVKLIAEYGSLEAVYEQIGTISGKLREKLQAGRDSAFLSRKLAQICREAPLTVTAGDCVPKPGDPAAARALLIRLSMNALLDRLNLPEAGPETVAVSEEPLPEKRAVPGSADDVEKLLRDGQTLYLYCAYQGEDLDWFLLDFPEQAIIFQGGEAFPMLARILESGVPKRVNGLKRLCHFSYKNGVNIQNVTFDPELAGYLLSPSAASYGIGRLAEEYGIRRAALTGSGGLPEREALADGALMAELCGRLETDIEKDGLHRVLHDIEIPLSGTLSRMELYGFRVDAEGIREYGEELQSGAERLEQQIYQYAGGEFNINSPKQLGEILFERIGLPTRRKNKSGYSTDAEVLESLYEQHPIVPAILDYRKLFKLKSTYVDGLLKQVSGDGRIHTVFRQTETRTGRISSTEPNLQNIPIRTELGSQLRKFFIPQDGWLLVDADYSQIELRVLAAIADDPNMLSAFREEKDIHTQTAAQVFDMPPEFVTPQMRSRAKAVNFGIVYGIGAFSLSKDIGVSVSEADRYIKNYLATYGGVDRYMKEVVEQAKADGYVTTLFGRRRYLPELRSKNHNTQAFGCRVARNTPIQGTAADIIKLAMIRVEDRLARENLRARLILQVHDELIVEAPEAETEQVRGILQEEMEHAADLSVKLKVDCNVGASWYDAK